jgi:hypothetical protein
LIHKIGTKAFAKRIKLIAMKVVSQHQNGFLPERLIFKTLLMNNEMLHLAKASGEDYTFLKLDAIKAFDSIEWDYLIQILEHIEFPDYTLSFVKAILGTASSRLIINGRRSEAFKISRSVRPGCLLSPCLFLLGLELLDHMNRAGLKSVG